MCHHTAKSLVLGADLKLLVLRARSQRESRSEFHSIGFPLSQWDDIPYAGLHSEVNILFFLHVKFDKFKSVCVCACACACVCVCVCVHACVCVMHLLGTSSGGADKAWHVHG